MNFKDLIKKLGLILVVLTFLLPGCAVFAGGGKMEFMDMVLSNYKYGAMLLDSVDPALGMEKGEDGNLLKKEKLTPQEQDVYDDIKKTVDELVKSADSDKSVLSSDVKKTKAIYNWVIENIAYDDSSLCPSTSFDFDKGVGGTIIAQNPDRKSQDVLSVYKSKKGVCAGKAFLFELMMRMAGLPCICVANDVHAFNAAWLDRGDKKPCWMLIDATLLDSGLSLQDNVPMLAESESVENPLYPSEACNVVFTGFFGGNHFVYYVCPPMTELSKDLGSGQKVPMTSCVTIDAPGGASIYCHNSSACASAVYDRGSSNSRTFALPESLVCLSKKWRLVGDFESIKNLDLFVDKGICLDIAGSGFRKVVEKDGVEFEIYGGGFETQKDSEGKTVYHDGKPVYPKSTLRIKPKSGVFVSEVEIPEELEVFLGDVDKILVESDSIKTVKYSLLPQCDSLKEGVQLQPSVEFKNVTQPAQSVGTDSE